MKDKFRSKPNFLVIGTPKSGTTSLYEYLKQHPDVYLPNQKELHFFSCKILLDNINGPGDKAALSNICKTHEDYKIHYNEVENQKAIGDISPSYFYFIYDCLPKIISELGENVKFILMLRDPLERAFSQYKHKVRMGYEKETFAKALQLENIRIKNKWGDFWYYADHSRYDSKLSFLKRNINEENIFIINYEAFSSHTNEVLNKLFDFLSIKTELKSIETGTIYNQNIIYHKKSLTEALEKNLKLKKFIKTKFPKSIINALKKIKVKILKRNISQILLTENDKKLWEKIYCK